MPSSNNNNNDSSVGSEAFWSSADVACCRCACSGDWPAIQSGEHRCLRCKRAARKICAGCHFAHYCSPECQSADYPRHRLLCKEKHRHEFVDNLVSCLRAAGDAIGVESAAAAAAAVGEPAPPPEPTHRPPVTKKMAEEKTEEELRRRRMREVLEMQKRAKEEQTQQLRIRGSLEAKVAEAQRQFPETVAAQDLTPEAIFAASPDAEAVADALAKGDQQLMESLDAASRVADDVDALFHASQIAERVEVTAADAPGVTVDRVRRAYEALSSAIGSVAKYVVPSQVASGVARAVEWGVAVIRGIWGYAASIARAAWSWVVGLVSPVLGASQRLCLAAAGWLKNTVDRLASEIAGTFWSTQEVVLLGTEAAAEELITAFRKQQQQQQQSQGGTAVGVAWHEALPEWVRGMTVGDWVRLALGSVLAAGLCVMKLPVIADEMDANYSERIKEGAAWLWEQFAGAIRKLVEDPYLRAALALAEQAVRDVAGAVAGYGVGILSEKPWFARLRDKYDAFMASPWLKKAAAAGKVVGSWLAAVADYAMRAVAGSKVVLAKMFDCAMIFLRPAGAYCWRVIRAAKGLVSGGPTRYQAALELLQRAKESLSGRGRADLVAQLDSLATEYISFGMDLEETVRQRKLKTSTIMQHMMVAWDSAFASIEVPTAAVLALCGMRDTDAWHKCMAIMEEHTVRADFDAQITALEYESVEFGAVELMAKVREIYAAAGIGEIGAEAPLVGASFVDDVRARMLSYGISGAGLLRMNALGVFSSTIVTLVGFLWMTPSFAEASDAVTDAHGRVLAGADAGSQAAVRAGRASAASAAARAAESAQARPATAAPTAPRAPRLFGLIPVSEPAAPPPPGRFEALARLSQSTTPEEYAGRVTQLQDAVGGKDVVDAAMRAYAAAPSAEDISMGVSSGGEPEAFWAATAKVLGTPVADVIAGAKAAQPQFAAAPGPPWTIPLATPAEPDVRGPSVAAFMADAAAGRAAWEAAGGASVSHAEAATGRASDFARQADHVFGTEEKEETPPPPPPPRVPSPPEFSVRGAVVGLAASLGVVKLLSYVGGKFPGALLLALGAGALARDRYITAVTFLFGGAVLLLGPAAVIPIVVTTLALLMIKFCRLVARGALWAAAAALISLLVPWAQVNLWGLPPSAAAAAPMEVERK